MFDELRDMSARPGVFARTTTAELWTDPHLAEQMLAAHLDPDVNLASYRAEFVQRSVRWIIERFGLGPAHHVADFGCGPGLHGNALARAGTSVTGLDISQRSVEHAAATAQQDQLPARYLQQDYLTYSSDERFDLITMIMRDYCALAPSDRHRLLRTVAHHLAPGGAFLFDVDSDAAFRAAREQARYAPSLMDGFWSDQPYFGFHHSFRYEDELVYLDRYDIVETDRTRTFYNWIQHFSPRGLRAELHQAGFRAELFGDVTGAPYDPDAPQFAMLATR